MTNLPVILLHAFPLNCALWADQAAALRAGGYDVRTPDFPGFGASPVAETQPDLDVFAGAVLGAADAVKLAWRPGLKADVDEDTARTLLKLIDTLDDDDDVQAVWGNYEISDEVMEKLA